MSDNGGQEHGWEAVYSEDGIWATLLIPEWDAGIDMPSWCARLILTDHAQAALAQRYRDALERIATGEDVAYLACADAPWCNGHPHSEVCAVRIARDALAPSAGQEEGTNA